MELGRGGSDPDWMLQQSRCAMLSSRVAKRPMQPNHSSSTCPSASHPSVCQSALPAPVHSTVLMPRWFLPLACTANLAKNLAAVSSGVVCFVS